MKTLPLALGALVLYGLTACTPAPTPTTVTVTAPASTVTVTQTVRPTGPSSTAPTSPGPQGSGSLSPSSMGVIELKVGERREITAGTRNDSARLYEELSTKSNEKVATAALESGPMPSGCAPGGCGQTQRLIVSGVAPGETTLVLTHVSGGRPENARQWKIVVK